MEIKMWHLEKKNYAEVLFMTEPIKFKINIILTPNCQKGTKIEG